VAHEVELTMPQPFETIHVNVRESVATVTLHRPEVLNAINVQMLDELNMAFDTLAGDPAVVVVVLTGAGRAFSAGVDLKALHGRSLEGGMIGDVMDRPARRLTGRLTTIDSVVVAKINGFCFTGALELAMATDLIVCADEAVLGDTHAKWGLRPTWGMSQRLPLLVGAARARELSYTARTFTGAEAASWGLAARACPLDQLDDHVAELSATIASCSRGSLLAYKDLYRAHDEAVIAAGLGYEAATRFAIPDTESRLAGFSD
jgi:enoyl-CoA hydratase